MTVVLGVDGCKGGWCVVAIKINDDNLDLGRPVVYRSFSDISASEAQIICVDIPIGLLDRSGHRECDSEARQLIQPKGSSVFSPPCRSTLTSCDYREACRN